MNTLSSWSMNETSINWRMNGDRKGESLKAPDRSICSAVSNPNLHSLHPMKGFNS